MATLPTPTWQLEEARYAAGLRECMPAARQHSRGRSLAQRIANQRPKSKSAWEGIHTPILCYKHKVRMIIWWYDPGWCSEVWVRSLVPAE